MMGGMRVGLPLLTGVGITLIAFAAAPVLAQEPKPTSPALPDPAALLAEAKSLYRKGSFDLALARYNEVLKADPKSGDAYAGIVRCYLKEDKVHRSR